MSRQNSRAVGPGEDFDIGEAEFARNVLPRKKSGVLFEFVVDVVGEKSLKIVGKFPDEQHSDRPTGNGNMENSIYTQAGIADTFIKGTRTNRRAGSGQWRQWAIGNIETAIDDLQVKVKRRLDIRVDEQIARAKKEWSKILRSKDAQSQMRSLKDAIKKARTEKKKYFAATHEKAPEFKEESGSIEIVELVRKSRLAFYARRKRARMMARSRAKDVKRFLDELDELKKSIVEKERSREWADAIGESLVAIRGYEESGDRIAMHAEQERFRALTTPFYIKSNLNAILEDVASGLESDMRDMITGMKAPPLSKRTIYNRRYRGFSGNVPLVESGEFAESFIVEVVAA